jgi:transposase InsO family protein
MLPEGTVTTEEKMTVDERRKYLRRMKARYDRATRKERGQLLDEMEAVTGMHRKHITRLLNGSLERRPRKRQRGRRYDKAVQDAVGVIAESFDYICAERLAPNLGWMAEHLMKHGELYLAPEVLEKLKQISISTTQRILSRLPQATYRPKRSKPKRKRGFVDQIPTKRLPWNERRPGYVEIDTVFHCGPNGSGEFICTVQMVDVATGWSERVAVLGRSYLVMEDAYRRILTRLPFPILEVHSDNGSEFLNHHLIRFWNELVQGVELSRGRPYQKNDNRFVEQKNRSLVRDYLGYDRLDTVAQVWAANQFYDKMWVYYNLFQPVMRLEEKIYCRAENGLPARTKRRHDQARTPFERLCETDAITPEHKRQLERLRAQTNPLQLRQALYDQIDLLFSLPGAQAGVPEDVYQTLLSATHPQKGDSLAHLNFNRTVIQP